MGTIKPAEVSAILLDELTNFDNKASLDVKGTVLKIGDGVAHVYGMHDVESGELVEFEKSGAMGMALNLEEDNVGVVLLSETNDISEGDTVVCTHRIASVKVGEGLLGRVINTLGQPIDGKGEIKGETVDMPLERKAPGVIFRKPVDEPLQTGIKASWPWSSAAARSSRPPGTRSWSKATSWSRSSRGIRGAWSTSSSPRNNASGL